MSVHGLILQTAYRLRRHFWGGWPLSRWLGLLFVVAIVWALIRWRAILWPAAIPAVLYLTYLLVLTWAGRRKYVRFHPLEGDATPLNNPGTLPPLAAEEMVRVRASGWFTVEGQTQYFVDVEADLETVGTREHIVLGRIHPSRFLLLGRWPRYEHGWWYIFFQPAMIRDLRLGHLDFGLRPQLALRVLYTPGEETRQAVYLVFDDDQGLRRVWEDLVKDAARLSTAGGAHLWTGGVHFLAKDGAHLWTGGVHFLAKGGAHLWTGGVHFLAKVRSLVPLGGEG